MIQVSERAHAGSAQVWERIVSEEGDDSLRAIVKRYLSDHISSIESEDVRFDARIGRRATAPFDTLSLRQRP